MNTPSFGIRWTVLLSVLLVAIPTGYQLFVSTQAKHQIDLETGRQLELDQALEWSRRRVDGKAAALRDYVEGLVTLDVTARRFQDFDGADRWEMTRLRRLWPSAASDEERHAADVLACLARRVEREEWHHLALLRAADDYRRAYGEPPVPVKL